MTNLSRRGFLIGVSAAAVVAAVPEVAARYNVPPAWAADVPIKPIPYTGPFYYLHKSEWAFFERKGFNMDLCRLVEQIPVTKVPYVRR